MAGLLTIFPGAGSQYPAMGRSLHDAYPVFRDTLSEAGDVLGMDITGLCIDRARGAELGSLRNAQLAVLAVSVATYRVMRAELKLAPHLALGHSLGEYAALCCAGAISFRATLEIISRREALIREDAASAAGTMTWVVNLGRSEVEEICSAASTPESRVYVSAYDHATQHSISGQTAAVTIAAKRLEAAGATLFPLRGSGPWHCALMANVAVRLRSVLDDYEFMPTRFPVISNLTARPYPSAPGEMRDLLARQLEMPLLLADSLRWAECQGTRAAVSPGPKEVMKFLVDKNSRRIRAYGLERAEQLAALRDALVLAPDDLGRVAANCLRSINTTPNHNHDPQAYRDLVVEPYRRLEAVYLERISSGTRLAMSDVAGMADTAEAILRAKRLPPDAVFDSTDRIWCGKFAAADVTAETAHV
ncbi:ACP S-malonyltransferase [Bradyrhizobium ontarionense]|uniref:[acyl-carrier-protein] S-malonyltransferase n=1 Tax=Bradyrhizobium ontarionense TaxID=2898149 RepID=A0ABY3RAK5_9BRAD|nr:ACP S-malonyltransferase [Bradyrhizobium sp. A19]UFZ04097.1 ACP S-malonyltransferase [Bradyrhizobium sp. A19]